MAAYVASGLPTGATFNPQTLLFNWTPSYEQHGTYQVTFTATDTGDGTGVDLSTSHTVNITVFPVDRPPPAHADRRSTGPGVPRR